jgi:alkylation response protein AidB-like acyl-CoA dehydrogenase
MGMRGSGSQTIVFDNAFVPDTAIVLSRPRNGYHPVWDVVIDVAMPLIMSVYVGIAEKSMEIAIAIGKKYERNQQHMPYIIGKMNNSLVSARTQWKAMVALTDNYNFKPDEKSTIEMLSLKTNVADACIRTVQEAMEAIGGQGFYRKNTLERLFRDVQASQFHPLPSWDQYAFTGNRLLK